jgi:hypothetical protein
MSAVLLGALFEVDGAFHIGGEFAPGEAALDLELVPQEFLSCCCAARGHFAYQVCPFETILACVQDDLD